MATLAQTRNSHREIFNEVRRKIGVNPVSALTGDSLGKAMVDYYNDVLSEVSDFGNWQEMFKEEDFAFTTANSSTSDFTFNTSAPCKNIKEIAFGAQISPLRLVTLDDIRRLNRTGSNGTPRQWAVVGVDNTTTGNPTVRVFPTPTTAQASANFHVAYYTKPIIITSATSVSARPEFPSRMLAQGLLAYVLKDEERGAQSQQWQQEYAIFREMMSENYNRFNGDMGSDTFFIPRRGR